MRILFDINVVLDVLLNRSPWVAEAQSLWDAVAQRKLDGYLAPTTITTIYYLSRKLPGGDVAGRRAVSACLSTFQICPIDGTTLGQALAMTGPDFEDDVQIACAVQSSLDGIVTRNPADFKGAPCRVYSPAELLAALP